MTQKVLINKKPSITINNEESLLPPPLRDIRIRNQSTICTEQSGIRVGLKRDVAPPSPLKIRASSLLNAGNQSPNHKLLSDVSPSKSSLMGKKKEQITIDQITPELAAQIIQKFVLPMFDGPKLGRMNTIKARRRSAGSANQPFKAKT